MKKKNIGKSIGAVAAGFITVFILSVLTDVVLEKIGIFPLQTHPEAYTSWMLLAALMYRTIYTIIGGYITAKFSPNKPMKHVMTLAIIGCIAAALGAIANWNKSAEWYPIMLVVLSIPSVWLGGKLQTK